MSLKIYFSIASNTIFQILSRVVTALVTLIATPLITSAFGRSGYGEYQMILTYVTLFWILTDFGLNAVIVREMAAEEKGQQKFFSGLLTLRTLLGGLLTALAVLMMPFLSYPAVVKLGILIGSLTIFFQGLMGAPHAVFQVKLKYDRLLFSTVIGSLVQLFLIILVVYKKLGVLGLAWAFAIGYAVAGFATLMLVRRWVKIAFILSRDFLWPLFLRSLPFGAALLLSLLAFKMDAILLAVLPLPQLLGTGQLLTNAEAVAVYSLPYRIFELALAAPTFFMNVLYPLLVRVFQSDRLRFTRVIKQILIMMVTGSLLGLAVVWVVAPFAIHFLAKTSGFEDSIAVLRILMLSYPLFFVSSLLMWLILVFQRQFDLIWVYGAALLFNSVANLVFIPKFSFWAAAWITNATEVLILILLVWFAARAWRPSLPI